MKCAICKVGETRPGTKIVMKERVGLMWVFKKTRDVPSILVYFIFRMRTSISLVSFSNSKILDVSVSP